MRVFVTGATGFIGTAVVRELLEGVPLRDIAAVIGRKLNLPVVSISREEVDDHFGWIGAQVMADNPTSNALTQQRLGWHPLQPALIPDIEQGHYFGT